MNGHYGYTLLYIKGTIHIHTTKHIPQHPYPSSLPHRLRTFLQHIRPIRLLIQLQTPLPLHLLRLPPLSLLRLHKFLVAQVPLRPRAPPLSTCRRFIQHIRIPALSLRAEPAHDPFAGVRERRGLDGVVSGAQQHLAEIVEAMRPVAFVLGRVGSVVVADLVSVLEFLDGVTEGVKAVDLVEPGVISALKRRFSDGYRVERYREKLHGYTAHSDYAIVAVLLRVDRTPAATLQLVPGMVVLLVHVCVLIFHHELCFLSCMTGFVCS